MKKQLSKKFHQKKDLPGGPLRSEASKAGKPQKFKSLSPLKKEFLEKSKEIKELSKSKSPSFYRSIPVQRLQKLFSIKIAFVVGFVVFLVYMLLIIAITSISIDIYKNIKIEQEVYAKRNTLYYQKDYWERVIKVHPGYRDAYYNLAVLEFRLGNIEKVKYYLAKIFAIDPNFKKGRELEKLLSN